MKDASRSVHGNQWVVRDDPATGKCVARPESACRTAQVLRICYGERARLLHHRRTCGGQSRDSARIVAHAAANLANATCKAAKIYVERDQIAAGKKGLWVRGSRSLRSASRTLARWNAAFAW